MDIKEYKAKSLKDRTLHVKLPSGLEIDIGLPTPKQAFLSIDTSKMSDTEVAIALMDVVTLPKGLTVEDFTYEDFVALMEKVSSFFVQRLGSLSGSRSTPSK